VRAVASGVGPEFSGSRVVRQGSSTVQHRPKQLTMAWNAVCRFAAGWFAMKTFDRERERRRNIAERLKMIGEPQPPRAQRAAEHPALGIFHARSGDHRQVGDSVQRIEWRCARSSPHDEEDA